MNAQVPTTQTQTTPARRAQAKAAPGGSTLTGTWSLVRLALRRDRIMLPLWALVTAVLVAGQGGAVQSLYNTAAERQGYADIGGLPGSAAFNGLPYGLTETGGIVVAETNFAVLLIIALASAFLTIRHTRVEEETGRAELTGSAVVGRHARLTAALLAVGGFNVVTAVLSALALMNLGLPTAGSLAFGLMIGAVGVFFAGVGAVAAQVVENARTARGLAAAALGVLFVLRAVGDASRAADPDSALASLSWLTPLGWALQIRPYAGERWWVLALPLAVFAVLVVVAVSLSVRRDVGAGMVAPRAGRATAAPGFASPLALAWRLQRGSLIGWTVGFAVMGVTMGALAGELGTMMEGQEDLVETIRQLGGTGALADLLMGVMMSIMGLAAAAYAAATVLRLRSEETGLHAEPVLGTAVSRSRWVASHLVVAAAGTALLMVTMGVLTAATAVTAEDVDLAGVVAGALIQIPAAWVVAGIALALFGLLPRLTVAGAWLAVVVFMLLGQFGDLLQLDQWVMNLSPFTHLPVLPGGDFEVMPLVWLLLVAVAFTAAGFAGFRRRDLG